MNISIEYKSTGSVISKIFIADDFRSKIKIDEENKKIKLRYSGLFRNNPKPVLNFGFTTRTIIDIKTKYFNINIMNYNLQYILSISLSNILSDMEYRILSCFIRSFLEKRGLSCFAGTPALIV